MRRNSRTRPRIRMSDDEMAQVLDRYGELQLEFEQRGGYDLDSRAKEILTGLGIGPGEYDRPVETFSGGWKMRIALAKILVLQPGRATDGRADQPPGSRIHHLARGMAQEFQRFARHDEPRPRVHEPHRLANFEVANKAITTYSGNYEFYLREREIRRDQLTGRA